MADPRDDLIRDIIDADTGEPLPPGPSIYDLDQDTTGDDDG